MSYKFDISPGTYPFFEEYSERYLPYFRHPRDVTPVCRSILGVCSYVSVTKRERKLRASAKKGIFYDVNSGSISQVGGFLSEVENGLEFFVFEVANDLGTCCSWL